MLPTGWVEYWIVDSERQTGRAVQVANGQYELVGEETYGALASAVVEGVVVPVEAIFDEQRNLKYGRHAEKLILHYTR
jgi:hypothetical protein